MIKRGRPVEQPTELVAKTKWTEEYYEYQKDEYKGSGEKITYHFDKSKNPNGAHLVEIKYPKNHKSPNFKPLKNKAYNKMPVVMVFKTSDRKNAKTKMKIFPNQNVDYIAEAEHLPGVPDNAVILEIGIGWKMVERYKLEYNL